MEEYRWMWHRGREFTSCGISGLHFGHFQASSNDPEIGAMDKWFIEVALRTGYSLQRWRKGIDVMIPKKVDSIRVDKLRTIVLLEPDFNFTNKIIGKRVMANAERAQSIAPEQFGSRKNKSAIIHAVNKQLTTDILRQDKKDFCLMVLDAKECYDRITPMIASFAMQRQGASKQMMSLIFDTIQHMVHFVRTSYGDSDITYQQGRDRFHGILQGNGAGPTVWAMISTIVLDRLRHKNMGVKINTIDGKTITIPAFAFVDDTDLFQELLGDNDTQSPQLAVNEWVHGIQTTGGLIIGDKCFYQVVRHKWKNNSWEIQQDMDQTINISVPTAEGNQQQIRQNLPQMGEVALGIAFSPTGNMKEELEYLKSKTTKWAERIKTAHLTHIEAWTALKTTIFKTIEYALPATLLSEKEMKAIVSPALNIGLSKAGICQKIARHIIYSPEKYQGFGLKDPYVTQGIKKLQLLFTPSNMLTTQLISESWNK